MYLKIPRSVWVSFFLSLFLGNTVLMMLSTEILVTTILVFGLWHIGSRPLIRYKFLFNIVKSNSPNDDFIFIGQVYFRIAGRIIIYLLSYYISVYFIILIFFTFMYIEDYDEES